MKPRRVLELASLGVTLLLTGCALLTKDAPIVPRYFTPETSSAVAKGVAPPPASLQELRLGRVNASAFIRDQIVHRDSAHEVGSYEEIRWTEKPEAYVRRALERAIFERHGVREVVSGAAMTLEVDVVSFEEVRGPPHVGRIRLDYRLSDDRLVRAAHSIVIERPIDAATGTAVADAIVRALATALEDAVEVVAEATVATQPAEPPPTVTAR